MADTAGLFGVEQFDTVVSTAVRVPAIRLVRDGRRIPSHRFCTPTRIGSSTLDDVADVRKVLDEFRNGASVILQSLHRSWAPLSAWCASLERELGWPVQANVYLTPAGRTALAPHRDGHDVFAIQLFGAKEWWVAGGTGGPGAVSARDGDGSETRRIEAGDVLYLPSGTEHRAHTTDRPSLHLTIGIHRPSADRIARTALDLARRQRPDDTGGSPADTVSGLRHTLAQLDPEAVTAELQRRPRTHDGGLLSGSLNRPVVGATTGVRPVGGWSLDESGPRIVLAWPAGRLHLPHRAARALRHLEQAAEVGATVAVGDLPGLGPDEQVVVARRLLDEGALHPVATTQPVSRPQPTSTAPSGGG